jgi:ubiquinone/menaquinone biosynthesis C-methylase UbiE
MTSSDLKNYVLSGSLEGYERLELLHEIKWPSTADFLKAAGLKAGMNSLDLGCGAGLTTAEIAEWVGSKGTVVGLDFDAKAIAMAREKNADRSNTRFVAHDVSAFDFSQKFDFIFIRYLLTHLKDPGSILVKCRGFLNAEGVLAVEDIDFPGILHWPEDESVERFKALYLKAHRSRGGDPEIGLKLRAMRKRKAHDVPDFPGV